MSDEGYGTGAVLLSFLLGGVVGAGLALLAAPQSGIETRRKIREMADDVKAKTDDYIDKTKEKVSAAVEDGMHVYEEKRSLVKSAFEAGREAYEKERERLAAKEEA